MSKKEIKEQYKLQIEKAGSPFEKQMLQAEMNHKLKMAEEGIDAQKGRDDSQFQCVGCGS